MAAYFHVCQMNSTQYSRGADTNGHTCKSFVEQVHNAHLCCTFLADDRGLGPRVDKRLNWFFVDMNIDVEHSDLPEELWELLLSGGVVLLNQTLLDLFFDLLLSLGIVWVSVHQSRHSLLLSTLFLKLLLHSLLDEFLQLSLVACLQNSSDFRHVLFQIDLLIGIIVPNTPKLLSFLSYSLISLVVEQLVEHLIEVHSRSLHILLYACEESVKEIFIALAHLGLLFFDGRQHQHVIVCYS